MTKQPFSRSDLRAFERHFDTSQEDKGVTAWIRFLRAFPLRQLKRLTLDKYVIGKKTASFCAFVEAKTKAWASIQGSPAFKFGVYFGRTRKDPAKRYRFTRKFGTFRDLKSALLDLLKSGKRMDFSKIDKNPLSQMFKAKILSLYFPDQYMNVCSAEHLWLLSKKFGNQDLSYTSECQHFLIQAKLKNPLTKNWSNLKFMTFLYGKYIRKGFGSGSITKVSKPKRMIRRRVNFADVADAHRALGRRSEEFALKWERDRLRGLKLPLKIEDRRNIPSYGYDFLSYSSPECERYIEVKSVRRDRNAGAYTFFLSENERRTSKAKQYQEGYYFYLVLYGSDGRPRKVEAKPAAQLYPNCILSPCAYSVSFILKESQE